jgi:hypothetical protein
VIGHNDKSGLENGSKEMEANRDQPGFPVLIVYPRPVRMVKKNKKDDWNPSITEINKREYNYVKLHRLSASFDIAPPSSFWLHIGFNGAFILPAFPEIQPLEKSVELFNRFIGKLILGGVFYNSVEPFDIDKGILYETGYFRAFGISHDPFAQIQATLQTKMAGPLHTIDLFHPKFIESSELHKAYKIGREVIESITNLSADLLLKGMSAFVGHSCAEALSNLWICLEQIISHLWDTEFVSKTSNVKPEIQGRKEFLKDDRTWTISAKIEMLFNKQIINAEIYSLLNKARKARNDLSHSGTIPIITDVEATLDVVFKLISFIAYNSLDYMDPILNKYKQMDPIKDREKIVHKTAVPVDQMKGIWLGPMPPIPGEKGWGNKEYEKVFK